MRIQRVVSHAIRPAPPEASRSTSNPPIRSPMITVVFKCLVFVILFKLFIAWQCSLVARLVHFVRGDA